jgi:hypothetical protein
LTAGAAFGRAIGWRRDIYIIDSGGGVNNFDIVHLGSIVVRTDPLKSGGEYDRFRRGFTERNTQTRRKVMTRLKVMWREEM